MNRLNVAREKIARAAGMLGERGVDAWVFYARNGQDPSFELMFGRAAKHETLVFLTSVGHATALCDPSEAEGFVASGLYNTVIPASSQEIPSAFRALYQAQEVDRLALNETADDSRCDGLSVGLYEKLCLAVGRAEIERVALSSEGMLEELRAVKTPSEIALMEECSHLTCDIYDEVFRTIHVGMSETEVGEMMVRELYKRGCTSGIGAPDDLPLVLLVRCGMSHRRPNPNNFIRPGDMLVIDFSARYHGYTSDIARTMYFLKPDEAHAPAEVKNCVDAAVRAVGEVLKVIRPGLRGYEVDAVGRKSILNSGYPNIPHSVGHQVGLECHDGGTVLGPHRDRKSMCGVLRKNEIYALEPTVLQDGGLPCAIVEDNVILTDDGCHLISRRQTEVIEIPHREESPS
jgi:Xaa-Pro aminopeptidase